MLWMVRFSHDGSRWRVTADTLDKAHVGAIKLWCQSEGVEKMTQTGASISCLRDDEA